MRHKSIVSILISLCFYSLCFGLSDSPIDETAPWEFNFSLPTLEHTQFEPPYCCQFLFYSAEDTIQSLVLDNNTVIGAFSSAWSEEIIKTAIKNILSDLGPLHAPRITAENLKRLDDLIILLLTARNDLLAVRRKLYTHNRKIRQALCAVSAEKSSFLMKNLCSLSKNIRDQLYTHGTNIRCWLKQLYDRKSAITKT